MKIKNSRKESDLKLCGELRGEKYEYYVSRFGKYYENFDEHFKYVIEINDEKLYVFMENFKLTVHDMEILCPTQKEIEEYVSIFERLIIIGDLLHLEKNNFYPISASKKSLCYEKLVELCNSIDKIIFLKKIVEFDINDIKFKQTDKPVDIHILILNLLEFAISLNFPINTKIKFDNLLCAYKKKSTFLELYRYFDFENISRIFNYEKEKFEKIYINSSLEIVKKLKLCRMDFDKFENFFF